MEQKKQDNFNTVKLILAGKWQPLGQYRLIRWNRRAKEVQSGRNITGGWCYDDKFYNWKTICDAQNKLEARAVLVEIKEGRL